MSFTGARTAARARGGCVLLAMLVFGLMLALVPGRADAADAPSRHLDVVGGVTAQGESWMAALVFSGAPDAFQGQFCGGALIAPQWVMTAAHCLSPPGPTTPQEIRVVIGRQDLDGTGGDDNQAAQLIVNPAYDPDTAANDVGLIRLAHPSPQTPLRVVQPGDTSLAAPGSTVAVLGWGMSGGDEANPLFPSKLQTAAFPTYSDGFCQSFYGSNYQPASMLCAGSPGISSCEGDSGGPLVALDSGELVEVGIVSWGPVDCGIAPGVYSRLSTLATWVQSVVGTSSPPIPTPDVTRLAGADRAATAVAVSGAQFGPGAADAVVLASKSGYADALVGVPLAVTENAPILLTDAHAMDPGTAAEVDRVTGGGTTGKTVYLLGGTQVIGADLAGQLRSAGYNVVRYGGDTRYDTAVAVADALGSPGAIVEATGVSFADALAGGAAAAHANGVVLLTAGDQLPAATAAYVAAHPGVPTFAVGGAAAQASPSATALVGADRYATAVLVAQQFFAGPTAAGVASGATYADALAGGVDAVRNGGPLLLTDPHSLPAVVSDYLRANAASIGSVDVYGGSFSVADAVLPQLETAII